MTHSNNDGMCHGSLAHGHALDVFNCTGVRGLVDWWAGGPVDRYNIAKEEEEDSSASAHTAVVSAQ